MVFKIKTKNCKISLKLLIWWQQPNNGLYDLSKNFRADRSWPIQCRQFYPLSDLLKMLSFQSYKPKSTFYPYVLFFAMAAILVGWRGHATHFLNKIFQWWLWPRSVKFGQVVSGEKIFVKVKDDGRRTTTTTTDAGRKVTRKAQLALRVRWAKIIRKIDFCKFYGCFSFITLLYSAAFV